MVRSVAGLPSGARRRVEEMDGAHLALVHKGGHTFQLAIECSPRRHRIGLVGPHQLQDGAPEPFHSRCGWQLRKDPLGPGRGGHGGHTPLHLVGHDGFRVELQQAAAFHSQRAVGGRIHVVERKRKLSADQRQPRPALVHHLAVARHLVGGQFHPLDVRIFQQCAEGGRVLPVHLHIGCARLVSLGHGQAHKFCMAQLGTHDETLAWLKIDAGCDKKFGVLLFWIGHGSFLSNQCTIT